MNKNFITIFNYIIAQVQNKIAELESQLSSETDETIIAELEEKIAKLQEIESSISAILPALNASNGSNLTNFDNPTINSIFSNYETYSANIMQFSESYKNKNEINNIVGYINQAFHISDLDLTLLNGELADLDQFLFLFNVYYNKINEIKTFIVNQLQPDLSAYFVRLKILMTKIKIADKKVYGDEYLSLYETRNTSDQQEIDEMYNVYVSNDQDVYIEYKNSLMYNIKIDSYNL